MSTLPFNFHQVDKPHWAQNSSPIEYGLRTMQQLQYGGLFLLIVLANNELYLAPPPL